MKKHDDVLLPFVELMRAELLANSDKGDREGWLGMMGVTAISELDQHVHKLHDAFRVCDAALLKEHAADVANCCMMLLDVMGVLPLATEANPWQELADAVTHKALAEGLRNYRGVAYTSSVDGVEQFEVAMLVQRLGALSPQEVAAQLRVELTQCASMADMILEGEWAEHVGTGEASRKVEEAFTRLHNELGEAREGLKVRDGFMVVQRDLIELSYRMANGGTGQLTTTEFARVHSGLRYALASAGAGKPACEDKSLGERHEAWAGGVAQGREEAAAQLAKARALLHTASIRLARWMGEDEDPRKQIIAFLAGLRGESVPEGHRGPYGMGPNVMLCDASPKVIREGQNDLVDGVLSQRVAVGGHEAEIADGNHRTLWAGTMADFELIRSAVIQTSKLKVGDPCDWNDQQVLDFLGVALRHVELKGELTMNDIREAFAYMRDRARSS